MKRFAPSLIACSLFGIATPEASAHPGHVVELIAADSGWHLLHPDHMLPIVGIAGVVVALGVWARKSLRRKPQTRTAN